MEVRASSLLSTVRHSTPILPQAPNKVALAPEKTPASNSNSKEAEWLPRQYLAARSNSQALREYQQIQFSDQWDSYYSQKLIDLRS